MVSINYELDYFGNIQNKLSEQNTITILRQKTKVYKWIEQNGL